VVKTRIFFKVDETSQHVREDQALMDTEMHMPSHRQPYESECFVRYFGRFLTLVRCRYRCKLEEVTGKAEPEGAQEDEQVR
jgi:hypothetical protein